MNRKAEYLNSIVDIVVETCATPIMLNGRFSFDREDLIGKSRAENVVMSRCILAMLIHSEGFSVTTISQYLGRTPHAIRDLFRKGCEYQFSSRAFRIALSEATLKVENLRKIMDLS